MTFALSDKKINHQPARYHNNSQTIPPLDLKSGFNLRTFNQKSIWPNLFAALCSSVSRIEKNHAALWCWASVACLFATYYNVRYARCGTTWYTYWPATAEQKNNNGRLA